MFPRALPKVAPLALAAILGIAACADDGDDSTTPSSVDVTTVAPATTGSTATTATTSSAGTTDAGSGASTSAPTLESLQDALQAGDLSTIAQAIDIVGVEELTGSSEFTLFAPNDEAFRSLTPAQFAELLSNPSELTDILKNHLVAERLTAEDLAGMTSVETAAGNTLDVVVSGDTVTVGGVEVVETDRDAGPGVIHVIDALLLVES